MSVGHLSYHIHVLFWPVTSGSSMTHNSSTNTKPGTADRSVVWVTISKTVSYCQDLLK